METVTLWLLITVGGYYGHEATVVERFPTVEQCEHVRKSIPFSNESLRKGTRCVEAKVLRP
ncbi:MULTISPECIES: hypothetical protein [Gammaproteobacteria]|uniref:Uncharacterized protein n=1 Tax=Vreelandella rituensis TaxID=2282306 RepID=A0A368TPH4_9GAMM|nr:MULTISPECIES: hypothetical protein [Gammaproteobacteria]MBQ5557935.1 hypothetical protein [Aeriscardovia sp.]MBQ9002987.1 hypothetical protein [Eggerthellaceae bacterium]MBR2407121.1 hypothetical protein [Clostridia bacterium]RCV86458.1 hypothetical protein DU506_18490 [Halomonas rituensis]